MTNFNYTRSHIGSLALTLLTVGSVDSIRNLPATALFGSQLIFFVIASALLFLIPCALVSAELSARRSDCGGIYVWIKSAFGKNIGLLAIWLQWINTLIWFPTILSFIASTLAYTFFPHIENSKLYVIFVILSIFWGVTFINLYGIKTSAKFSSLCTSVGTGLPLLLIICLGLGWVISGHTIQISLKMPDLVPTFNQSTSWLSLTAIITSFLGIELSSAHVHAITRPQKTFPKVILISTFIIISTTIIASLSVAFVISKDHINLLTSIVQSFSIFLSSYNIAGFLPLLIILIIIGNIGGMVNWMISPNKGVLLAIEDKLLPEYFGKLNKYGIPFRLFICHACVVSALSLVLLFEPDINNFYWLLTALSTQIYILLYIIMFIAALYLRYRSPLKTAVYRVPGGNCGLWLCCLMGLTGCIITLVVGFIPPDIISVNNYWCYETFFSLGLIIFLIPPIIINVIREYKNKKRSQTKNNQYITTTS